MVLARYTLTAGARQGATTMQKGKTLQELAAEIDRQRNARRDFTTKAEPGVITVLPPVAADYDPTVYVAPLRLGLDGVAEEYGLGPVFHDQLAARTKIPKPYYDRMLEHAPALLAGNANHWLRAEPQAHLVRTLDGRARALLSDRFRPLDHDQLAEAVFPALAEHAGLEVLSCEITERRLYLQVASARLEGEVKRGDVVRAGITVRNSEVGAGRMVVEGLIYRLVCLNGLVTGEGFKKAHLGRRAEGMSDGVEQYFKNDTVRLSDAALFAQVRDVVAGLLTEEAFGRTLGRLQEAAGVEIENGADLAKVVEVTAARVGLNKSEASSMLRHLIDGGDLSKWGVANSVTRLAHDAATYDRAFELEQLGAKVVEMPQSEWREIQKLAA
jgi:hypothetical protein